MTFLTKNNDKLYYEIHGKGEPILIIAGGGADSRYYAGLASVLAENFQVILMDPRGSGKSDRGLQQYSFDLLVSDLVSLLRHLDINKINILGHSMGGMTAQYFAYQHPEYVKKLILWATSCTLSAFGKHCCKTAALIKESGSIEAFIHVMAIWNFSNAFFENESNIQNFISEAKNDPYPLSTSVFLEQMKLINNFDSSSTIEKIDRPTLVIGCEKDIIFPVENVKNMTSLIKNVIYREVKGATHSTHIENPKAIAELVSDYLLT